MKLNIIVEMEIPDGATHFTGDLLHDPTWWKFLINSTKAVQTWCYWNEGQKRWFIQSEHAPHFLKSIPTLAVSETAA